MRILTTPQRRILGYRRGKRGWNRLFRRPERQRTRGSHPQFGWTSNQYWNVDSEHFDLTTNLSARAGQQAATFLERVHDVWQQLFYEYWSVPGRLTERFQGEDKSLGPDRTFSVVLFRDREEYVRQLARSEPQIGSSVGYYAHTHKTAFFYGGDEAARSTWIHESTHQFFQESGTVAPRVGQQGNFWIIEGIALYMESLIDHDTWATTGGVDADRLQFARFRKLSEGYYVPLSELVEYGSAQVQKNEEIRQIYSQSAGLSHFFMHGEEGRMMRPLIEYVKTVYRGAAQRQTLELEVGTGYAQLDSGYQAFLNVTDADLVFLNRGVRNLCLGHTAVTDTGLEHVRGCTELQWLDLSFTAVGDAGLVRCAEASKLQQLNLEQTRITDRALDTVSGFRQLQELDLSQTAVTNQGLAELESLSRLEVLWLTGTQITDEGLSALSSLRNLEQLDVEGTRVTPAALDQLRKRLPKLK